MVEVLDWTHSIGDIPEAGLAAVRHAPPAALAEIAAALDLLSCDRLTARYEVKPLPQGRYLLAGTLEASVTQPCVVTLEPVETLVTESFEVEFRPGLPEAAGIPEFDALEARDIEPLEGESLPVGRIVYDHLASAIPAYPRKEGIAFEPPPAPKEPEPPAGPFSVLESLKKSPE